METFHKYTFVNDCLFSDLKRLIVLGFDAAFNMFSVISLRFLGKLYQYYRSIHPDTSQSVVL